MIWSGDFDYPSFPPSDESSRSGNVFSDIRLVIEAETLHRHIDRRILSPREDTS